MHEAVQFILAVLAGKYTGPVHDAAARHLAAVKAEATKAEAKVEVAVEEKVDADIEASTKTVKK